MTTTTFKAPKRAGVAFQAEIRLETLLGTRALGQIQFWNDNPRMRFAASRKLNDGARGILQEARAIAHAELRQGRESYRKPPRTREWGKSYADSFTFAPATQDSIGRLISTIENRHPAALMIEKGTPRHDIPKEGGPLPKGRLNGTSGWMIFPYASGTSRYGGPGSSPGTWLLNAGGSAVRQVDHPGTKPYKIMERAVARQKRKFGTRRAG